MKKKMKKVCAGILCAALALTVMVPTTKVEDVVTVAAEENYDGKVTYCGRTYRYKIKGETEVGLVSVEEQYGELGIPSRVMIGRTYYSVTSLEYRFGFAQKFSKVYVPNTVKTLGERVFEQSKIDVLQLSNNLEEVGLAFCIGASVNTVSCRAKNIKEIKDGCFQKSTTPEVLVLGNWLIKAEPRKGSRYLDLSKSSLANVDKVYGRAISFDESVTELMLSSKIDYGAILKKESFKNRCNRFIENVYIDGCQVRCNYANDTCPNIIKKNYSAFEMTPFSLNYSYDKAKYLLKKLGIKYYGKECEKVKGTLSVKEEYDIALTLHDYIVNNYVYDENIQSSFDSVFNCHTVTKCQYDAEMYAFLLECAGVESEVVFSAQLYPVSSSEKEKRMEENPGIVFPKGNYIYGYEAHHGWNAVKIGGKWYYIDTTADRKSDFYACFLFSNETIEKGTLFYKFMDLSTELSEEGKYRLVCYNDKNHVYPHFLTYEYANNDDVFNEWNIAAHPFQTRETMLGVPECNETNGDIDKDYYCYSKTGYEIDLYRAFLLQTDEMQQRIMNSKDGYITASEEEIAALNGVGNRVRKISLVSVEKTTNKVKLLINSEGLDINFDGKISVKDMIELMNRSKGKPSDNK